MHHLWLCIVCAFNSFDYVLLVVFVVTLLSGARNGRQSDLAQKIYNRMQSLFPHETDSLISGSILLSNIYLSTGDHEEARKIRLDRIRQYGTKVNPGVSWTEIGDEMLVREFLTKFFCSERQ